MKDHRRAPVGSPWRGPPLSGNPKTGRQRIGYAITPLKLTAGDSRGRFAVADVSSKYKNDKGYFVPLYQEIDNGGGAAMLYDLLHMDLQGWHPRYDVPKTAALRDQKELSLSAADQWWYEMLKSGALARYDDKNVKNHPRFAPSRTLMDTARKTVPGLRFESDHMLGRILGKKGCLKQRIENVCGWRFPDLKEARATWDEQMPGTRWEDQEEWGVAEPF